MEFDFLIQKSNSFFYIQANTSVKTISLFFGSSILFAIVAFSSLHYMRKDLFSSAIDAADINSE